eukprot:gene3922-7823_t
MDSSSEKSLPIKNQGSGKVQGADKLKSAPIFLRELKRSDSINSTASKVQPKIHRNTSSSTEDSKGKTSSLSHAHTHNHTHTTAHQKGKLRNAFTFGMAAIREKTYEVSPSVEEEVNAYKEILDKKKGLFDTPQQFSAYTKAKQIKEEKRLMSRTKVAVLLSQAKSSKTCTITDIHDSLFSEDGYVPRADPTLRLPILHERPRTSRDVCVESPFLETKFTSRAKVLIKQVSLQGLFTDLDMDLDMDEDLGPEPETVMVTVTELGHRLGEDTCSSSKSRYSASAKSHRTITYSPTMDSVDESLMSRPHHHQHMELELDISTDDEGEGDASADGEDGEGSGAKSVFPSSSVSYSSELTKNYYKDKAIAEGGAGAGGAVTAESGGVENYFGPEARTRFFSLYQRLASSGAGRSFISSETTDSGKGNADADDINAPRPNSSGGRLAAVPSASARVRSAPSSIAKHSRSSYDMRPKSSGGLSPSKNSQSHSIPIVDWGLGPKDYGSSPVSPKPTEDSQYLRQVTTGGSGDLVNKGGEGETSQRRAAAMKQLDLPNGESIYELENVSALTPLPIILRHKEGDVHLNLAHRSLRDDYMVLGDLPALRMINIRDNCLSATGMGAIVKAFIQQPLLTEMDLSENTMGGSCVEVLSQYLQTTACPLKTLRLSKNEIDDPAVKIIMHALESNDSVECLDLSHNVVGGANEMRFRSDSRVNDTGGAYIASALLTNTNVNNIDLSWNKMGPVSIVQIGRALHVNQHLMHLSLAYNAVKNEGAEVIGYSLSDNDSIQTLNLSHAGIGSKGCFMLAVGLRHNRSVKLLNMTGNPIGEDGGKFLLQSINYHGGERETLVHDCPLDSTVSGQLGINMFYPSGEYALDLAVPFNRFVAMEFIRMASMRRGCRLRNVKHQLPRQGQGRFPKVPVVLVRPANPAPVMGHSYGAWISDKSRPRHPYTEMNAVEWEASCVKLLLHDQKTGKPWELPLNGMLYFEFQYLPRCACPIEVLNATGQNRLIQMLKSHPSEIAKILRISQSLKMETYQLEEILREMSLVPNSSRQLIILSHLLICVRDTSNTISLLRRNLQRPEEWKELQRNMRSMYFVCVNAFTGTYKFDLSQHLDRLAAIRLAEISADENAYIRRSVSQWQKRDHGFTSQKKNRTNFRNEVYKMLPVERGITDAFFAQGLTDKCPGMLEVDFVSISRAAIDTKILSDDGFNVIMIARELKAKWSTMKAMAAMIFGEPDVDDDDDDQDQIQETKRGSFSGKSSPCSTPSKPTPFSPVVTATRGSGSGLGLSAGRGRLSQESAMSTSVSVMASPVPARSRRVSFAKPLASSAWIFAEEIRTVDDVSHRLRAMGSHHMDRMRPDDIRTFYNELHGHQAVFYVDDMINRFVSRVAIRVACTGSATVSAESLGEDAFMDVLSAFRTSTEGRVLTLGTVVREYIGGSEERFEPGKFMALLKRKPTAAKSPHNSFISASE